MGFEAVQRHPRGPVRDYRFTTWDFRFLQAWVQKLDLTDVWVRYQSHLGAPHTRRIQQRGVELLRQLSAVASRLSEPGATALLRDAELIRLDGIPNRQPAAYVPTLEEFRESLDDPDFYTERELLERWQEEHGQRARQGAVTQRRDALRQRAQARRARLLARQLSLLQRLERAVATPPSREDPVSAWLQPAVSERLGLAGIETLGQLQSKVTQAGAGWYHAVPRLGRVGARSIEFWLERHAPSLMPASRRGGEAGFGRSETGGAPSELAPLERLALTGEGAEDLSLVRAWLERVQRSASPHTWRSCRKEGERLLLWTVFERRIRLVALTVDDARAYLAFLSDPPRAWCGPRGNRRPSPLWRPLEGALTIASRKTTVAVLRLLFDDIGGSRNPWRQVEVSNE